MTPNNNNNRKEMAALRDASIELKYLRASNGMMPLRRREDPPSLGELRRELRLLGRNRGFSRVVNGIGSYPTIDYTFDDGGKFIADAGTFASEGSFSYNPLYSDSKDYWACFWNIFDEEHPVDAFALAAVREGFDIAGNVGLFDVGWITKYLVIGKPYFKKGGICLPNEKDFVSRTIQEEYLRSGAFHRDGLIFGFHRDRVAGRENLLHKYKRPSDFLD